MFEDIIEIYNSNEELRDKYSYYYGALHRLCTEKVSGLTANYNDFFSRLQTVCRLTNYPLFEIDHFRWRARRIMQGDDVADIDTYYNDVKVFLGAYAHFSDTQVPESLAQDIQSHIKASAFIEKNKNQSNEHKSIVYKSSRFVVVGKGEMFIYADCKEFPRNETWKILFSQNEETLHAASLIQEGMQINAISFTVDDEQGVINPEMMIIEPDYLIDVTTLCGCLKPYGDSPLTEILNKLKTDIQNKVILIGNVAGQFLDDCLNNPEITYKESIRKAFKQNLIGFSTCDDIDKEFFNTCKHQFDNIKKTVQDIYKDPNFAGVKGHVLLEPSFFCEALGIQGRFDFLQTNFKNLIELKSGKWDDYRSREKEEHLLQMILYKEIMYHNLGIHQLKVSGYLLYSAYPHLVEQRTAREMVYRMMCLRNSIVIQERDIKDGNIRNYLEGLQPEDLNLKGKFDKLWTDWNKPELQQLLEPFQSIDSLTIDYFYTFYTFVSREQYLSRVGDGKIESTRGMANLWNADLETKLQNGDIIINAKYIQKSTEKEQDLVTSISLLLPSNFENSSMVDVTCLPNFRVGDSVILYERNAPYDNATTKQVIRCGVESYDKDSITLQLKTPMHTSVFDTRKKYAIEHDNIDSSSRSQFSGLYSLLTCNKKRRELLLCRRNPEFDETIKLNGKYLNEQIDNIVLKAKQAKDFFLLVGPPGTGKTSVALTSMIDECMAEHHSLLLLSYTNRAVDEICEVLKDRNYIRIGRELSCDPQYHSHLLSNIVGDDVKRSDVIKLIQETQIVVGTVTSMTSSKALFSIKQFDVAIFDEASQILEPQLLPLLCDEHDGKSSIRKFIMIGDHKQLPAVVVQNENLSKVESDLLKEIGLIDCRNSLFERLYSSLYKDEELKEKGTAILDHQGRMHPVISEFASKEFYGGLLLPVGLKHQTEDLPYKEFDDDEKFVATHRFGFVDVPLPMLKDRQPKMNKLEADKISKIVSQLISLSKKNNIEFDIARNLGIIVPFRRQIVAVRTALRLDGIPDVDKIMIDTVERYQGSQRDVIIYGTTITQRYELDMLSNIVDQEGCKVDRKLNVAITRARKQLFVLGNKQLLSQNPLYKELIEYAQLF